MSDKIIVNEDRCIGCYACVTVCSKKILEIVNEKTKVLHFDNWACGECLQCMAVCPTKAISILGHSYDDFPKLPHNNVTYSDFRDLLSSRRSVRSFENTPIDKETIGKIIKAAEMAPIGAPPSNVNATVLNSSKEVDALYENVLKDWKKLIKNMKNPFYRIISKRVAGASMYNSLIQHGLPASKVYCDYADNGRNVFTFGVSSLILFHGEKLGVLINENCWLACSYATIAAHSLGLGGTLSGMLPPIINMSKTIKKQLGIPKNHKIISCLLLGHPSKRIKYLREIPREFLNVEVLT